MPVARVMIDGRVARVRVPEGTTPEQARTIAIRTVEQRQASRPKSFLRGVADEVGNAVANYQWAMDTIQGRTLAKAITGQPTPSDITRAQVRRTAQDAKTQPSTLGRVAGGILGSLPAMAVPGGAFAQGAASGFSTTRDPNNPVGLVRDMAIGGVGGKAGQLVGKNAVAPVAERIGRTAPARAVSRQVARVANKVLPNGAQQLPLPKFTPTDRAVTRVAPQLDDARRVAADAARLKMPIALADTDPRLQQLAGSVARHSPDARALAERTLNTRALGQADRAINAIDEKLAPITNIRERAGQIMDEGKPVYGPLYEQSYAAPPVTSPGIQEVLQTPVGREAIARANRIAANEFRDPKAMGFVLDADGNVVLQPSTPMTLTSVGSEGGAPVQQPGYTTQSLDYVKRGIDDILEPQRNVVTGRLNLDEDGKAILGVKNRLIGEVDQLNPAYREARDAYGQYAKRAEALNTGHDVLPKGNLPMRDFQAITGRATPDTMPELQRGYATAMSDEVAKRRLTSDPYTAIYGGLEQQAKVASLFPEGVEDFGRIYDIERTMAQTRNKALGGSQTQANKAADDLFQNDAVSNAVDMGFESMAGGMPGAGKVAGIVARRMLGPKELGVFNAQRKADAIAPTLFDTSNPSAITNYLDDLNKRLLEQEMRRQAYQRAAGLFGAAPVAAAGVSLLP